MYTSVNPLEDFEERATATIMKDRNQYSPFMEAIEKFASRYKLMACNQSGNDIYLRNPVSSDSFVLEFYSQSPKNHSRQLANELLTVDSKFNRMIQVVSKVPQQIYTIFVNCRELTTIYRIPSYHDMDIYVIMDAVESPGRFSKSVLSVVGTNIQLMEIYKDLTNLGKRDMWPYLSGVETRLRADFEDPQKVRPALPAPEEPPEAKTDIEISGGGRKMDDDHFIDKLVYSFCVSGNHSMLVGPMVLGGNRLQIVTSLNTTESERLVNKIAESEGIAVQIIHASVRLPIDIKLARFSVKIKKGVWKSIADVFNLATYEMLPFVRVRTLTEGKNKPLLDHLRVGKFHPDTKIATLPTLLRMRLIDMWSMKIVSEIRTGKEKEYAERIIGETRKDYLKLGKCLDSAFKLGLFDIIFPARFVGDFVDERIALSRDRQKMFVQSGLRPDKYLPALSIKGYEQDEYIDMVFQP